MAEHTGNKQAGTVCGRCLTGDRLSASYAKQADFTGEKTAKQRVWGKKEIFIFMLGKARQSEKVRETERRMVESEAAS